MTRGLLALFAVGCVGANFDAAQELATAAEDFPVGTLRVDMYPADDDNHLLPQSFLLAPDAYGDGVSVDHAVAATVSVTAQLLADPYLGWESEEVPASEALYATLRGRRAGLIQAGAASTDDSGWLTLSLPGQQPYEFAIVPADAALAPVGILSSTDVAEGIDLSRVVSPGAPVYGRVTDLDEARVANVPLRMRRADSDVYSATFYADDSGWFLARAEPGYDYVLETIASEPSRGVLVPAVEVPFSVADATGAEVAVNVGDPTTFAFTARVVNATGDVVSGATFRATSRSLDGSEGVYTVQTTNQDTGYLSLDLLAGTYDIEVWPRYADQDLAPVAEVLRISDDVDAGDLRLEGNTTLVGRVLTADGEAVAGATVTAQQRGAGEYSFSTTTDQRGDYELGLPAASYNVVVAPDDAALGALSVRVVDGRDGGELDHSVKLAAGTPVNGSLRLGDATVPYALVEIVDPNTGELLARDLTDADGNYAVRVEVPVPAETDDTGG